MKRLIEDYLAIRAFYPHQNEQTPFPTSMEELADILCCSQRNAKFILTKLVEAGLVSYSPGRGRGNKSRLAFLKSIDDATFDEAVVLFKIGKITEGSDLAALYGTPSLQGKLLHWLNHFLGYEKQENEQKVKDIIRIPMFRTFNSMTPSKAFFDFDVHLIRQVFDTIVEYDYSSKKAKGKLAHHWECNRDKTEWTFFLRKGVLFHNGRELTSADIYYTFSLLFEPNFEQYWLVENIRLIECLDPYTIRFHLHKPNVLFLSFLSFPALSIISSGSKGYIGTGPFKIHTYHENGCILGANSHYYEGRPFLDRIEILNVPQEYEKEILVDNSSIFVNTGERHYDMDDPSRKLITGMYEGSTLFTFNLQKKERPQHSIFFRKAVNKLIDRRKLISDLGAPRMFPSFSFDMKQSLSITPTKVEDKEIQYLLQESGYQGETLQLFTYDRHQPDAEWFKTEAIQYGIPVHVTILGWNEILKKENINQADCILFEAVWGENEMSKLELYQSDFSFLRQHLSQKTADYVDKKIEAILASKDKDRSILFSEIETRLISEQAVVFLVHKNIESTFHPSIKGVHVNTRGNIDFKNIWISPEIPGK